MRPHAVILSAFCGSAAAACVPTGWPLSEQWPAAPDAASDASRGTDAGADASPGVDAGCPATGCDWMTGDLGSTYFPPCGDGTTGWGPASSFVDFQLEDGQGRVVVRVAYQPSLPLGMHDFAEMTYPVTVGLTPELGGPDIGATSVTGTLTLEKKVWRVEFTATFATGDITGCIDGAPLW